MQQTPGLLQQLRSPSSYQSLGKLFGVVTPSLPEAARGAQSPALGQGSLLERVPSAVPTLGTQSGNPEVCPDPAVPGLSTGVRHELSWQGFKKINKNQNQDQPNNPTKEKREWYNLAI